MIKTWNCFEEWLVLILFKLSRLLDLPRSRALKAELGRENVYDVSENRARSARLGREALRVSFARNLIK